MRFEQLTYFEAAVRAGSFRRAAIELGVAQPTISAQIQRLEEDLGVVLVVRGAQGARPTYAGERLLPHVRAALRAEQSLRQEAGGITGLRSGRVRLGSISAASQGLLPHVVQTFRRQYPNVHFQVTEGGSAFVRDGVASGEFDGGVLARFKASADKNEHLRYLDLAEGRLVLAIPSSHPLASASAVRGADLAGQPMIVFQQGTVLREALERLTQGIDVDPVFYTTSAETAQRMVGAGVGIALANTLAPSTRSHEGVVLAPLQDSWAETRLSIVLRADEQPTPAVQSFIQVLRDEAGKNLP